MSRYNERSLGDIIREVLKRNRLEDKITETRIMSSWEKVMGQHIARYTNRVVLQRRTLIIYLRSSVLRNELSMGKNKIIKMLNEEIGEDAIDKITFR